MRNMIPSVKDFVLMAALVGALGFGLFVWPTRYRYDHVTHQRSGAQVLVRIDRISGNAQYLSATGWKSAMGYYLP